MEIKEIGYIETPFKTKFGIPRQSGICKNVKGKIVFNSDFRNPDALRGIDGFSHLWILWGFSMAVREKYSPTVRPPRLGGNTKMGVFATRSPFRPNPIALSCVKIESVQYEEKNGYVIIVSGVDMLDKSPVYDIKPYLPFTDCIQNAKSGFCEDVGDYKLNVVFDCEFPAQFPEEEKSSLISILEEDPRVSYIDDENRIYGFQFLDFEIKFKVQNKTLTVLTFL